MSICLEKALSRPLGVAQGLTKRSMDPATVYAKIVVLTGEAATLSTENGRWCYLDAMRLLSRVVGRLRVLVPPECPELLAEVRAYGDAAWSHREFTVFGDTDMTRHGDVHAVLNVGTQVRSDLPWTSINANGWIARVSSGKALPSDSSQANPMAALMAASLGVTEVFKRIFEIPDETGPLLERTEFSLYELSTPPTHRGPPLPGRIVFPDMLLTGAGAIGNAIALLLSQLPLEGRLQIVDRQRYRDENLGTCLLLEKSGWLNEPKAVRLATWLNRHGSLQAEGIEASIEATLAAGVLNDRHINLVLNGLDDPAARRVTQQLWPAVIIDGGINEVGAAVTEYRLDWPESACLMCWFEAPQIDVRELQSKWTGLRTETLEDGGRQLSDCDIEAADRCRQPWLREQQRQGKTVCSIITEAQLASRLGVETESGFRPSVPFVAAAAAALVIAQAVKSVLLPALPTVPMFQMGSLFLGPERSAVARRVPTATCHCQRHRNSILRLRQRA